MNSCVYVCVRARALNLGRGQSAETRRLFLGGFGLGPRGSGRGLLAAGLGFTGVRERRSRPVGDLGPPLGKPRGSAAAPVGPKGAGACAVRP